MKALGFLLALVGCLIIGDANADATERDREGRTILRGPQRDGNYYRVHIISDSVGIDGNGKVVVENSVIEAPVCISAWSNVTVTSSVLLCNLCVQVKAPVAVGIQLYNNQCAGQLSNR